MSSELHLKLKIGDPNIHLRDAVRCWIKEKGEGLRAQGSRSLKNFSPLCHKPYAMSHFASYVIQKLDIDFKISAYKDVYLGG